MGLLFLLFTLVPIIELYLLVRIGTVIGAFNTLLLVLITGFVGAWLARAEGMRVVREWQAALQQGRMPEDGVLSGLLILLGGVMLITPGIVTDFVGLWLLLPASRQAAARLMRGYLQRQIDLGNVQVQTHGPGRRGPVGGAGPSPGRGPRVKKDPRGPIRGDVIDTSGEDVT